MKGLGIWLRIGLHGDPTTGWDTPLIHVGGGE